MSFLGGLLSILTGGISNIFANGSWNNLGSILGNAGEAANDIGNQNLAGNLAAKYTGSRLTDAEREANAWTAQREDIAWERQMQASNTAYQRQVADMTAAGLNPAMLYSGGSSGASVPSMSPSGSVSPAGAGLNLGSLLQMAMEMKLLPAKLANINADTAKKVADADSTNTQTGYFKSVATIRAEAERLENEMKGSQIRALDTSIRHEKARIAQTIENTKESDVRQEMILQQAILANVQAANIKYMQPFLARESSSRAGLNDAQSKIAAVEEAFKQGLIDEGAIAAAVRLDNANASEKEISAKVAEFKKSVADGTFINGKSGSERLVGVLYQGLDNLSKSILGKW